MLSLAVPASWPPPALPHMALSVMPCHASCFYRWVCECKNFLRDNHFHICMSYIWLKQILGTLKNTNYLPPPFTCEPILGPYREASRSGSCQGAHVWGFLKSQNHHKDPLTLSPISYQELGWRSVVKRSNLSYSKIPRLEGSLLAVIRDYSSLYFLNPGLDSQKKCILQPWSIDSIKLFSTHIFKNHNF